MTRQSKQGERRAVSPRKNKHPSIKTGPKKDKLAGGYKPHENALASQVGVYIPKMGSRYVKA